MPLTGCDTRRPELENTDDGCLPFDEKFSNNIAKWGSRSIPACIADRYYKGFKDTHLQQLYVNAHVSSLNDFSNKITNKLKHYPGNALTYKQLLGINTNSIQIGSHGDFETYRSLISNRGWQNYKTTVRSNFSNIFNTASRPDLSCKSYLKRTFVGGKHQKHYSTIK